MSQKHYMQIFRILDKKAEIIGANEKNSQNSTFVLHHEIIGQWYQVLLTQTKDGNGSSKILQR